MLPVYFSRFRLSPLLHRGADGAGFALFPTIQPLRLDLLADKRAKTEREREREREKPSVSARGMNAGAISRKMIPRHRSDGIA